MDIPILKNNKYKLISSKLLKDLYPKDNKIYLDLYNSIYSLELGDLYVMLYSKESLKELPKLNKNLYNTLLDLITNNKEDFNNIIDVLLKKNLLYLKELKEI